MQVRSFIEDLDVLEPVEVEMTLWAGVPEIIFLGLPDQHMRESSKRIKSAIRAQGFQFPVAQQVLVNLKPSNVRKSSRGLELAVAACYLWLTEQVKPPEDLSGLFIFGELSLRGEATFPHEFNFPTDKMRTLLTGRCLEGDFQTCFPRREVQALKDLAQPVLVSEVSRASDEIEESAKPLLDLEVSEQVGRVLEIAAWGEHSILIAGPAGVGKTTLAQMIHLLMRPLENSRPFIKPHPSTPLISLLGGQRRGELSKAHGGVLCLDEFLEFKPEVLDSLREPLQDGFLRVSRLGRVHVHPAQFQLVATTNLCPCGDFIPGRGSPVRCRFSLARCRSYSHRLSGPLLDRFTVLAFITGDPGQRVRVGEIRERVLQRRSRLAATPIVNQRKSSSELERDLHPYFRDNPSLWDGKSLRRKAATLRVARTLADLQSEEKIKVRHLNEAMNYTIHPFRRLQDWDLYS